MTTVALTKRDQIASRTLDAERAVLGGILMNPEFLADAQEHVTPADFFRVPHRLVFDACLRLAKTSKPIDLLTVAQALTPGELEEVGGPIAISDFVKGVPTSQNVGYYAQLVKDYATIRGLERAARQILIDAEASDGDAGEVLSNAERAIFTLRDRTTRAEIQTPRRRASDTFRQIEAITAAGGALRGVPTGLTDLDVDLRGLHPGNLITVAGRTSMGKTAFVLTVCVNAARATGMAALLFSLEMSAEEVNLREVTMRAMVNSWQLTHGRVSEQDHLALADGIEAMTDGGVHVVDAPALTVSQIHAMARRAKASHGLSLIAIDYLQLIRAEERRGRSSENRTIELGEMTRSLKGMARELNVPLLLLSQLSRAPDLRADKRPQLSDLRESGSIEQDSDVVLLLFRPNYYDDIRRSEKYPDHYVECHIAKQRNGPTGPVKLALRREFTKFEDYTEDQSAAAKQLALGPTL